MQESAITLSVSTAFNNGTFAGLTQPDLVLVSSDETLFYVHGTILSGTSFYTALTNLHSEPPADSTPIVTPYACPLPEDNNKIWVKVKDIIADELNIVLHALYNTSCAKHQPKFDTVARAIDKMASLFGLVVKAVIRLGNEFYNYILTITPLHPLRVYALAAHHRIHSLAVKASAHLLSYPIGAISDEESERMGAIYLRKLFLLQMERKERLIGLLFSPLRPHASVPGCGPHEQKTLKGLWTGALANLIYDLRAGEFLSSSYCITQIWAEACQIVLTCYSSSLDVSSTVLQRALEPLKTQIPCSQCVDTLQTKVNEIIGTWVSIRVCLSDFGCSAIDVLTQALLAHYLMAGP